MKRLIPLILVLLISVVATAQNEAQDSRYGVGAITTNNNGRVEFTEQFMIDSNQSIEQCYNRIAIWAKGRFAIPNVIKSNILNENVEKGRLTLRIQQEIVFKRSALVTDVSLINYNLSIVVSELDGIKSCRITMTDISYCYEQNRDGGGSTFTAEEWIVDSEAFNKNKTKFLKTTGKFRIKTIDLKELIFKQCKETIDTL